MIPELTPQQIKGIASHEKIREERCKKINAEFEKKDKATRYQLSEEQLKELETQEKKKKETEEWLKADLRKKK
jgi:lipoate-protein ligase A